jgi:effector-binding domain-containing protein
MSRVCSIGTLVALVALAASARAQQPSAPAAPAAPAKPAFDVELKTTQARHVVVLPVKGSYMQHPDAFGKLGGYLAGKKITPTGPAFGRYFSAPTVAEADLVWEVGFPVPAGVSVEPPYEIKDLPAELSAIHVHKGPLEELGPAWGSMMEWVIGKGYQPQSPVMQVFNGDMMSSTEVEMIVGLKK